MTTTYTNISAISNNYSQKVNGWLDLSVRLRPTMDAVTCHPHTSFFNGSIYSSLDGHFNHAMSSKDSVLSDAEVVTTFRPYQTMLLLQDEETVVNALPPDSSHQV